jgi:hypothetical protein
MVRSSTMPVSKGIVSGTKPIELSDLNLPYMYTEEEFSEVHFINYTIAPRTVRTIVTHFGWYH